MQRLHENSVAEAGWPTYSSMTAELDRFENLLEQLLRLARAEQVTGSRKVGLSTAVAESTEVGDVLAERVAFWQPILDSEDQQLHYRSGSSGWRCRSPAMTWSSYLTSHWRTRCARRGRHHSHGVDCPDRRKR
jgi:signal transduction histidine kinase